jgi:hypothetical protein
MNGHLTDNDLERYHLGMVKCEAALARIEAHYLGCPRCAERTREAADYVDALRAGIIEEDYDMQYRTARDPLRQIPMPRGIASGP